MDGDLSLLSALVPAVFAVALLYSSVGHAGASGYIAVMTLAGLAPAEIRPVALTLNVAVAAIASVQFARAGHFSWRLFWPFALLAAPGAFVGGALELPVAVLKALLGAVLLYSAARFLFEGREEAEPRPPRLVVALPTGAVLGFLAGATGTGGGIFLTPLLLLARWARARTAAAVSALFILVNSITGLAGHVATTGDVPRVALPLAAAAVLGGAVGATAGSRRLEPRWIKRLLAAVLVVAGTKLLFFR